MVSKVASIPVQAGPEVSGRAPRVALALLVPAVDGLVVLGGLTLVALLGGIDVDDIGVAGFCFAIIAFLTLAVTRTQQPGINPRVGDELPALVGRVGTAFAITAIPAALASDSAQALRRLTAVGAAVILLIPIGRALSYSMVRSARMHGHVQEPTLIIGAGKVGAQIAAILLEHPDYGMRPIGFLDSSRGTGLSMPVLGDARALAWTIEHYHVTKVVVAFGAMPAAEMVQTLRDCGRLPVELYVIPRFFELGVAPASLVDDLWGIPLIRLRRPALRPSGRVPKRALDIVVSTLALALGAPVLLAAAVAVRCSSPGPVLFRQKRVGLNGKPFEVLKLRTLTVNGDSDTTWSVADDHRRTRVGAILRRTSIDELPQLINVLRGEMSLVGPRPERPYFAKQFSHQVQRYDDRHRVLGGITGWAQVHGLRGDTPIDDRARFDNHYIEHWSLWHDIVILVRTVGLLARLR